MIIGSATSIITVVSAAIAAIAACLAAGVSYRSIGQARDLHEADTKDRLQVAITELQARQLIQISHVVDLVALVRERAKSEADPKGNLLGGGIDLSIWNTRMQLQAGLAVLVGLGGPKLPACRALAMDPNMNHVSTIYDAATKALEELSGAASSYIGAPLISEYEP